LILFSLTLMSGLGTGIVINAPTDTGNGDPANDREWENERAGGDEWIIGAGEYELYDGHLLGIDIITINNPANVMPGSTLRLENLTIIMNGTSSGSDSFLSIRGTMILINSTIKASGLLSYSIDMRGVLIMDNSSIRDCSIFLVNSYTSTDANFYAVNSCLTANKLRIEASNILDPPMIGNSSFISINTNYSGVAAWDLDYEHVTWTNGYQHLVHYPAGAVINSAPASRTIAIEDVHGNTTQTNWADHAVIGQYLHMANDTANGWRAFGAVEFRVTGHSTGAVMAYEITYDTLGIYVTLDYPSTWDRNQVEVYGHQTQIMIENRTWDGIPFYNSPYSDGSMAHDTDRSEITPTVAPAGNHFTIALIRTRSVEINNPWLVAAAGADQALDLGDTLHLDGTASSVRSTATHVAWVVADHAGTTITTLSAEDGAILLDARFEDGVYTCTFSLANVENSYDADILLVSIGGVPLSDPGDDEDGDGIPDDDAPDDGDSLDDDIAGGGGTTSDDSPDSGQSWWWIALGIIVFIVAVGIIIAVKYGRV
jgi:hypothetical protein